MSSAKRRRLAKLRRRRLANYPAATAVELGIGSAIVNLVNAVREVALRAIVHPEFLKYYVERHARQDAEHIERSERVSRLRYDK
jgi:hypothetical protein